MREGLVKLFSILVILLLATAGWGNKGSSSSSDDEPPPRKPHVHTMFCQRKEVLNCTLDEHTHGDSCRDANGNLTCTQSEHTHQMFSFGGGCYTWELDCDIEYDD